MQAGSARKATPREKETGPALSLAVALLIVWTSLCAFPLRVLAREGLTKDNRIALIRGLVREIGVAKVAFPRGKRGVWVDSKGTFDKGKADEELRMNGLAIKPGVPVEITKIKFGSSDMMFELNGGKGGKKWYERIEIGMGTQTAPVVQGNQASAAFGSYIRLAYPEEKGELTVARVKQMLSAVLDFERHSPTVLYSPNVPPHIKEAIKNHQVIVGMDRDAVFSSKGAPERRIREVRDGVEQEDWIYGLPPHVLFVKFDGDQVVEVKQY
ncbi:MAG TPA: hypothetical protein VFD30_12310 [Terriglobia bacterium]|nr:hypothetical protein [Terriglobia bacterium]